MKLDRELERCGCEREDKVVRERIDELKELTSPTWSVDDLVCHPQDAIAFCNQVRADLNCPNIPDYVILKTLMNNRKAH